MTNFHNSELLSSNSSKKKQTSVPSKEEAITVLENTITQLKKIVEQINEQSLSNLANQDTIEQLVITTEELTRSLELNNLKSTEKTLSNLEDPQSYIKNKISQQKARISTNILDKISYFFRKNYQIVLGIVIIFSSIILGYFVWFSFPDSALIKKNGEKTAQFSEITENSSHSKKETELQKQPIQSDNYIDNLALEPKIESEPKLITPKELKPKNQINYRQELTPEQNLPQEIQNKFKQITSNYKQGLILKIRAQFSQNYLEIICSDTWYELSKNSQNKLAEQIWEEAKKIDLYKLQLQDRENYTIARSPRVGKKMIILRRSSSPELLGDRSLSQANK
jgi:hypothetical protein